MEHATHAEVGHALIESADTIVLADVPAFKSRVATEGDRRFAYCEASSEAWDSQNEMIVKSLLLGSQEYFLRFGNIDLDHLTVLAPRVPSLADVVATKGVRAFEIGKPVEVRDSPAGVVVKGEIYRGRALADEWWHSVTEQQPPMQYFASVYVRPDPESKRRVWVKSERVHKVALTKGEWSGLGFAREPVNRSLAAVQTTPFGVWLKAVDAALALPCCEDCADGATVCKAITAGNADGTSYPTDPATLTGGAAVRRQSMGGLAKTVPAAGRYLAKVGTDDGCPHAQITKPRFQTLVDHFRECEGQSDDEARATARHLLARVASLSQEARQAA